MIEYTVESFGRGYCEPAEGWSRALPELDLYHYQSFGTQESAEEAIHAAERGGYLAPEKYRVCRWQGTDRTVVVEFDYREGWQKSRESPEAASAA